MSALPRNISPDTRVAFYHPTLARQHLGPRYWGSWMLLGVLFLMSLLPLPLTRPVGSLLGLLMFAGNAKRRRIARVNLRLCFPELGERRRARLLRRHFVVFGQSVSDLAHLAWNSPARLRRMVRLRGIEQYRELLQQGHNVILLVPHLSGMNMSGVVLGFEHRTFCIVKPLRNPVLDWFLHRARTRFGGSVLTRDQGLRPAIQALKRGYTFHYSPDEDLGPKHSVFAPFFGVPTATLPTLGRIAAMAQATVIPTFVRLLPFGRGYEVILQTPLANLSGADEIGDATRMNRAIEEGVRAMPEQYLWTFKLFKTRPDNAPSPYER